MRRRAVRDLGTALGVVAVLGGVVIFNTQIGRVGLAQRYEEYREQLEGQRSDEGTEILRWDVLKKTKGGKGIAPSFVEELRSLEGAVVNLIGFMVPLYQTAEMTEFMILPLPIQCYFCENPPVREVMLVAMAEGEQADYVEEPVLISGTLKLNDKKGAKFFYSLEEANWGAADKGGALHRKQMSMQHRMHALKQRLEAAGIDMDAYDRGVPVPEPSAEPVEE